MQIVEEYLERHSIRVPFVRHQPFGCVFRKTNKAFGWELLQFQWNESVSENGQYSIGSYEIKFVKPNHDIGYNTPLFSTVDPQGEFKTIEFELYILNWIKQLSQDKNADQLVFGGHRITLIAWEMFVYMHDSYFAKNSSKQVDYLFKSLDYDSTWEERYANYNMFLLGNRIDSNKIWETWTHLQKEYISNYCHWLKDLVRHFDKIA